MDKKSLLLKLLCVATAVSFFIIFFIKAMPDMPLPDMPMAGAPIPLPAMEGLPPEPMVGPPMPIMPDVTTATTQMPVAPVMPGVVPTPGAPPPVEAPPMGMEMGFPVMGAETTLVDSDKVGVQGNWVKKREWLRNSLEINDEIQGFAEATQQSKSSFLNKFNAIDNELDNFYRQGGFKQGKLQVLFDDLEKYLAKKREKELAAIKEEGEGGITSEAEIKIDMVEEEMKSLKNELEQLKLDMKSIEDLDRSLMDHLKVVDEQIDGAVSESDRARKMVDDIWFMIDDKKARVSYYELKGNILEKVKVIKEYIQVALANNFDLVISTIRSQMPLVRNQIKSLEDRGFIIENRATRLEQLRLKELEALQAGKPIDVPAKIEEEKRIEKSWGEKIYDFFVGIAANIYKVYRFFIDLFQEEQPVQKTVVPATTTIPQASVATVSLPVQPSSVLPVSGPPSEPGSLPGAMPSVPVNMQ